MQNDSSIQNPSGSVVVDDSANSDLTDSMYSIGKAAKYLGVSIDTLRRWEAKGKMQPHRSPGGHRYYLKEELDRVFDTKYSRNSPPKITLQTQPTPQVQQAPTQTIVNQSVAATPTAQVFRPSVVEEIKPVPKPESTNTFYPPEPYPFNVSEQRPATTPVQVVAPVVVQPAPAIQPPPIQVSPIQPASPVLSGSLPFQPVSVLSPIQTPTKPAEAPQLIQSAKTDSKLALIQKISLIAIVLFILIDLVLVFLWYQNSAIAVP